MTDDVGSMTIEQIRSLPNAGEPGHDAELFRRLSLRSAQLQQAAEDEWTVLREAERQVLYGERRESYGEPVEFCGRVAEVWAALIGHAFTAHDVALMLSAFKLCRESHRHHADNLVDAAGYVLIAQLAATDEN